MTICISTWTVLQVSQRALQPGLRLGAARRWQSTLRNNPCNPQIYVFPDERSLSNKLLTVLPTSPPNPDLALGSTSKLPPTPDSFSTNPRFMSILREVLERYAHEDPDVISSAQAYASQAGSSLGSGGAFFLNQPNTRRRKVGAKFGGGGGAQGDGAGGASAQGGHGGAGRGGYVHVWDRRRPPDFGRIPDPEDIFGSLEVDGEGKFVDGHGRYQDAGTYRLITPDGILGLPEYLRGKLVERLEEEERNAKR